VRETPKPAGGANGPWEVCSGGNGNNPQVASPITPVEEILAGGKLPTTDWQTPTELPDLRRIGILALDLETNDEGLRADLGSAWPWHGGYVCGVSTAYRAGGEIRAHYFPIRHPDSQNFDPAQVFQWLKDHVASGVRIVTQNGLYDWGWLRSDGGVLMPQARHP
jgi:hypothetical protein